MDQQLFDWNGAANYCGIPASYLKTQIRQGTGPTYIQPSPRKTFFARQDLDKWVASWKHISRTKG